MIRMGVSFSSDFYPGAYHLCNGYLNIWPLYDNYIAWVRWVHKHIYK
ncbi:hypothetical protein J2T58_002163 [Methanocalculus alkaliphilus]|nr:hypothetical protein [Methanocalculus alkaliphilus]